MHWAKKAASVKIARLEGYYTTLSWLASYHSPDVSEASITFHPPSKRRMDIDGMLSSCKAYFDGISDALGIDDSCFNTIQCTKAAPVKGGKVIVELS